MKELRTCPVCGADAIRLWYTSPTTRRPEESARWHIWRCGSCAHGFLNPQPTWDELAAYYTSEYDPYDPTHGSVGDSDQDAAQHAREVGELRHIPIPDGKRVLDVGCGGGWFLRIARLLGARVQGVEPSQVAAGRAREQGLSVFHGTLEQYVADGWDGEPFDVITASHVLEHVPDPEDTLRRMKSLLAGDGSIWLSVPNAAGWSASKLRSDWYSVDVPYHLQQFVPGSLTLVAERAGLHVVQRTTHSQPRALAVSIALYLRRRFLIPRKVVMGLGLDAWLADRVGPRVDRKERGEAIHVELAS